MKHRAAVSHETEDSSKIPDFFIDFDLPDSYNPASPTRLLREVSMRATGVYIMALALFSTILAAVSGCDDSIQFLNNPPGGLVIIKNKCYLGPDDLVTLTGSATDADGDSIYYSWTAEAGTLSPSDGKGQTVTWLAPDSHGTYRVTLKATDGLDVASKGIDLDVGRNLDILHDGGILDQTDYAYIVPNATPLNISELITVRIEAGVTVVFNEGTGGFNVGGTLIINGTQQDRVLLMPNVCPGEERVWKGIRFSGYTATGTLNYITMTSAAEGLSVENGAHVTADNIIVDLTTGDGVSVKCSGNLTLLNSKIWENGAGICIAGGTLQTRNTSISYNGNYGFSMTSISGFFDVDIIDCVVANNGRYGFVLADVAGPVVNNCSIFLNGTSMTDIRAVLFFRDYTGTDPVDMTGNYWGATTAIEIESQIKRDGEASGTIDYSGWLTEPPV